MNQDITTRLRRTIENTAPTLHALSPEAASRKPGLDKWSIQEILGHLIDSAVNNHHRFIRAQQSSDVFVFPSYAQDSWVALQGYNEASWQELIDLWRLYNHHLCRVIERIDPEALPRECRIGDYPPMTLEFLIQDYLDHLEHHLKQIDALMAG